jgi:hypothetical protein
MNKWILVFLLALAGSTISRAQSPFGFYFQDTLKPGHRISGSLDSVDCYLANYQHSLPNFYNPFQFSFSYSDLNSTWFHPLKRRFSAIPHIAMAYSMGSKLAQLGRVTYTHALDSNTYLQIDYTRNSSNGNLRNSKFERNSVQLALMHAGKYYGTVLDIDFAFDNSQQNGGLVGDSLRLGFPLVFQSVTKNNATSKQRQVNVSWKNYFSFTKNEQTKFGLLFQPKFSIHNARFSESDTLNGLYGLINYDSTQTYDYRELTSVNLNGGAFYKNSWMHIEAGLDTKYWDYDNLIRHQDTTELGAFASVMLNPKGFLINLTAYHNFVGATNQSAYQLQASKRIKDRNEFEFFARFEQRYPFQYQRSYYGNTIDYSWTNKLLMSQLQAKAAWKNHNRILPVKLAAFFENNSKMPVFLNGMWKQDTLTNLSVFGTELSTEYRYKSLLIQARGSYRVSTGSIVPNWLIGGRIAYNGTLFKGKKLKTVTGIDVGYISHFSLLDFAPYMNTYTFANTMYKFSDQMKLHFFTQFDLGYFRWFIRVENIEQTFLKKANYEALGYPVVPFQFRFGVSWDFFN